jgi:uncharacterized protein GlcG (DUF336 family)
MGNAGLRTLLSILAPLLCAYCSAVFSPPLDARSLGRTQAAPLAAIARASSTNCTGSCASPTTFLTQDDVRLAIAQAVSEARAQNKPATIAIVDRVGNVLGVYRMAGALPLTTITSGRNLTGGLENLAVPSELAAIAKAITGAYLSSEGNAFSTRTASQILQQHFNPGIMGTPSGPLFGVQFSQLPCSDLSTRFATALDPRVGPHRSPLGLSADPGGFPLYKDGTPVGGIGVAADGIYSLAASIDDNNRSADELIAVAGTYSFDAPRDRQADRISVGGLLLRYSNTGYNNLGSNPASAPNYNALGSTGQLLVVPGYSAGAILDGTAHGQTASGIRADSGLYPGLDAFVLDDGTGVNRYPPIDGTDGGAHLTAQEVRTLLQQALTIANRARAQIRNPLGSQARASVSMVDTNGAILGIALTRDAPVFGIDVSLQKARTAMFLSSAYAANDLNNAASAAPGLLTPAAADYLTDATAAVDLPSGKIRFDVLSTSKLVDSLTRARTFLGMPGAFSDGAYAYTPRALGNVSRPLFPDGIDRTSPGPFSLPLSQWSPFNVGQQLDLVYNRLAIHLIYYLQQSLLTVSLGTVDLPTLSGDVERNCTGIARLRNGIQIFPGGVPIYRNGVLVGGIGVSGDGVDQDDMISFLGVNNASAALAGAIANAPASMRIDRLDLQGQHLRYVQCPQAPFLDTNDSQVCAGK